MLLWKGMIWKIFLQTYNSLQSSFLSRFSSFLSLRKLALANVLVLTLSNEKASNQGNPGSLTMIIRHGEAANYEHLDRSTPSDRNERYSEES